MDVSQWILENFDDIMYDMPRKRYHSKGCNVAMYHFKIQYEWHYRNNPDHHKIKWKRFICRHFDSETQLKPSKATYEKSGDVYVAEWNRADPSLSDFKVRYRINNKYRAFSKLFPKDEDEDKDKDNE